MSVQKIPKPQTSKPPSQPSRSGAERVAAPLRRQILTTARALLNEQGVAAFSLREVARRAQVTHQAPYHHFGDRESILAELVTEGFDELACSLAKGIDCAAQGGAQAAAQASGEAYIGFALANPGLFRLMFSPDLCDPARFPGAVSASRRAHGELERLVHLVHGPDADEELQDLYWAYVHGLSALLLDGPLGQRHSTHAARQAHARRVGRRFVQLVVGPA
ncbi:MAG: TetR/AcrR family transcriptional regulator [Pseudochelatococcus sp.]|jgi:AcrR family transcriptional regulator